MEKKLRRPISFSSKCFFDYRKYPNNDNKICLLPFFSCIQQHYHEWFYVRRYNTDLSKLEWGPLLFNFNYIRDLTNKRKLFSIPIAEYSSFLYQIRKLKTNLLGLMSNFSKYHFQTGTICLLFFIFTCIYSFRIL